MRKRSDEGGFTIVEIIVAVTIVALVLGGVVWMVMSSAKASQRSDIRQKMAAAADGLAQQVRSNKDWLDAQPACKEKACIPGPIEKYSYKPKSKNDPKFTSEVVVTPVDSDVDGVGAAADKDHIIPDMYRIAVTITLSPEEKAIWGEQTPFNLVSTVDATQLGKATGSLTIQVCIAKNQVDERMAIAGCKDKSQKLEMRYQPPCKSDETLSPIEVERRVAAGQTFSLSCNAAIAETKDQKIDGWSPGSVDIEPVKSLAFRVVPRGNTQALARTPEIADEVSGDGGAWSFTGLGTGDYQIELPALGNLEVWESHVVPQDLKVSIQSNQEAKAVVILRPKQAQVNAHYEAALMRNVYIYQLRSIEQITSGQMPDPAHFAVVNSITRYRYLKADLLSVEPRTGPSWNGYLAMEPKPFDRYREKGSKQNRQFVKRVGWKAEPMVDDPSDGVVVWNTATGSPMPTGLYSRPEQLSVTQEGFYGQLDKEIPFRGVSAGFNKIYDQEGVPLPIFNVHLNEGKMICTGVPCGGPMSNYAYLDPNGQPTSSMLFYDMADGECYIESAVPEVPIVRQLMGGGELEGTGLPGQDRCERDVTINGARVGNFVPDRTGMDGKTVLWRTNMTYACVPVDSCIPRPIDMDRTMIPNPGTIVASDAGLLPTPLRTDIVPAVQCTAAMYIPPSTCPPPYPWTSISVNPLQSLLNIPVPPISAEEKRKVDTCKGYMKNREASMQQYGWSDSQLDQAGWKGLSCKPACPMTPAVNKPFSAYKDSVKNGGSSWQGYQDLSDFSEDGQDFCPPGISGQSQPYNDPPPAPPVEPPTFTGPNPDQGGTPAIPVGGIPGSTPLINGGSLASNGRTGIAGTCFVAGTEVLMADGSYEDIEDIEIGDMVMSGDPDSARKVPRKVTKLFVRPTDEILVDLSTRTGSFTATAYHPIWNTVRKMWWGAFDMTGSYGLGSDDKQHLIVRSETHKEVGTKVYNFTIGGTDAYFVKAGKDDILVRAQEPDGKLSYNPPGT